MDLIDRGKFWDNLNEEFEMGVTDTIEAVNNALDDTPTVDAVPVTRCKDCQFYTTIEGEHGIKYNICEVHDAAMKENDFCSYAEPVEKPVEGVDK